MWRRTKRKPGSRTNGTNPRANGTNPRAKGTNFRALIEAGKAGREARRDGKSRKSPYVVKALTKAWHLGWDNAQ
jgi:hypothetical protein